MQHFIPHTTHSLGPWDPGQLKDTNVNWCVEVRDWGLRLSSQRLTDDFKMWPDAVLKLNHPVGVQIVCLCCVSGFLESTSTVD